MSIPDTTICYDPSGSDVVNVYNKIGPELQISVPLKMTIENIAFNMIDSLIYFDDTDNCLTERKQCWVFNETSSMRERVDSSLTEDCSFRYDNIPIDVCHRAPKYHMFTFHPYTSAYGLTEPPVLTLESVEINDVYYEMNSLVHFNLGGHVNFYNSKFRRFSNWGSILKNYNPTIQNIFPAVGQYTDFVNNFNLQKNSLTSDIDCTGKKA